MKEFRITLISDPTDEYPHNKNNNFKVRLPVRLNLEKTTNGKPVVEYVCRGCGS